MRRFAVPILAVVALALAMGGCAPEGTWGEGSGTVTAHTGETPGDVEETTDPGETGETGPFSGHEKPNAGEAERQTALSGAALSEEKGLPVPQRQGGARLGADNWKGLDPYE